MKNGNVIEEIKSIHANCFDFAELTIEPPNTLPEKIKNNEIDIESINEKLISETLYTSGLKDPDLLIRTSGVSRISNFLLWQLAYTEIYITDVLWPDFRTLEFYKAIYDYQNRERRFGMVSEQLSNTNLGT
jgi:undecaprenyl diphosphate synthase